MNSSAAATKPVITHQRMPIPLKEVRRRLGGLSQRTLYNFFNQGELLSFTIGRKRFVMSDEIERFLEARIQASQG